MERSRLLGTMIPAIIWVAGCSGGGGGGHSPEYREDVAIVEVITASCECFWGDEDYWSSGAFSSLPECLAANGASAWPPICFDQAHANHAAELVPAYTCWSDAAGRLAACYRAAGCDMSELDACEEAYSGELRACPDPPDAADDAYVDELLSCVVGEPSGCPDGTLGSRVGGAVEQGTTFRSGNDFVSDCGGTESPDLAFTWTAPSDGTWVFDTEGSYYVTTLSVRRGGCEGSELACDAAPEHGEYASVEVRVSAGETVLVVVDGDFAPEDAGLFTLNIREL